MRAYYFQYKNFSKKIIIRTGPLSVKGQYLSLNVECVIQGKCTALYK